MPPSSNTITRKPRRAPRDRDVARSPSARRTTGSTRRAPVARRRALVSLLALVVAAPLAGCSTHRRPRIFAPLRRVVSNVKQRRAQAAAAQYQRPAQNQRSAPYRPAQYQAPPRHVCPPGQVCPPPRYQPSPPRYRTAPPRTFAPPPDQRPRDLVPVDPPAPTAPAAGREYPPPAPRFDAPPAPPAARRAQTTPNLPIDAEPPSTPPSDPGGNASHPSPPSTPDGSPSIGNRLRRGFWHAAPYLLGASGVGVPWFVLAALKIIRRRRLRKLAAPTPAPQTMPPARRLALTRIRQHEPTRRGPSLPPRPP